MTLMMDNGIRRGTDGLRALAQMTGERLRPRPLA
jgi:hypothetical protein